MDEVSAAIERLRGAEHIIVLCHYDPDGDAIGTMLGLTWALRAMGKQVTPACDDGAPWPLDFLPGSADVHTDLAGVTADLVVVVDCSEGRRAGRVFAQAAALGVPVMNIDHHVTNTRFGEINLAPSEMVASAEVVFNLLKAMDYPLDQNTATCLLTGLVTDTRCFKTANVDQRVLKTAIALMDAGASLPEVAEKAMERKDFRGLAVLGEALHGVRHEDGVTWSAMPLDAWKAADGDQMSVAPRNFSSMLNAVEGTYIGVFFTEMEDRRVDISMRSKPGIDLTTLFNEGEALHKQGGGHSQASGAEVDGPLEAAVARVVPALKALVGQVVEQPASD